MGRGAREWEWAGNRQRGQGSYREEAARMRKDLNGSPSAFLTLSLMTLSVIVCLIPNEVYYTWQMMTDNDLMEVYLVVDAMQRLTTVFDPVLIVLGNTELRKMVGSRLRFC